MAKILCPHCGQQVKIRTSDQTTKTIREVRTDCHNEKCLARSVYNLSYSHDTQPPLSKLLTPGEYVKNLLASLNDEQKKIVLSEISNC